MLTDEFEDFEALTLKKRAICKKTETKQTLKSIRKHC